MRDKVALITGVANNRSIAWGIAQSMADAGARVVLTYQNERLVKNVQELAAQIGAETLPLDASEDAQIDALGADLSERYGVLDVLVHSMAFAHKEDLGGRFVDTTRAGFGTAMEISAYTLVALSRMAEPLMTRGGSILTLSYLGAERVIPNYNVMGVAKAALECCVRYLANDLGPKGIRVNAISAGPLNTLAARGISGFSSMVQKVRAVAPLRRNTELEDVGGAAVFLASDLGRGVTGETLYVDSGYHVLGMYSD